MVFCCKVLLLLLFVTVATADPKYPGGTTTVANTTSLAFSQPAANLPDQRLKDFFVGNSFFKNNWVQSPASATARDGLGPHFIARSCSGCHLLDGRGRPPVNGNPPVSLLLKTRALHNGAIGSHPQLGEQLTIKATYDQPPEAVIQIDYQTITGQFDDGMEYELLQPIYTLELPDGTDIPAIISPRVAPQIIGLGLLEAISEDTLQQWVDNGDNGISGRISRVTEAMSNATAAGRFGWKAAAPSVLQQTAGALNNDIGITSPLFPQTDRDSHQNEAEVEINSKLLNQLAFYSMTLAVPEARIKDSARFADGQALFRASGCGGCHIESVVTDELEGLPELSDQTIHPYTDLLLHDLGEGLADQYYPSMLSDEADLATRFRREWRTSPLWGIGLIPTVNGHSRLLHDGRARDISEAILWHGGEAESAKLNYLRMSSEQRTMLLEFLNAI